MDHLANLTRIVLGTSLLILCNCLSNYSNTPSQVVPKHISSLNRLLDQQRICEGDFRFIKVFSQNCIGCLRSEIGKSDS